MHVQQARSGCPAPENQHNPPFAKLTLIITYICLTSQRHLTLLLKARPHTIHPYTALSAAPYTARDGVPAQNPSQRRPVGSTLNCS